MNISNTMAENILADLGYKKVEKLDEDSTKVEDTKVESEVEEVAHSCPLCNSSLEEEITEENIDSFVNSLVIEESTEDEDVAENNDDEDSADSKKK